MSFTSIIRKATIATAATGAAFGLVLGGSTAATAANDPSGGNTAGNHVATGSDTLDALYGSFADSTSPDYDLDSFTAFGSPDTITLNGAVSGATVLTAGGLPAGNSVARPAGSGDGVELLSATYNPNSNRYNSSTNPTSAPGANYYLNQANPVIDIARSSSRPSSSYSVTTFAAADLVYVPLARDAVSVAVKDSVITDLSTDSLNAIYGSGSYNPVAGDHDGDVRLVGSGATATVQVYEADVAAWVTVDPKLPQSSSGTRSFFLSAIGVSAKAAWVEDGFDENDASALTASGQIIPFSAAQWIAQWNNVADQTFDPLTTDVSLIDINSSAPVTYSGSTASAGALFGSAGTVPSTGSGTFARDVYSVVLASSFGTGTSPVVPATAGSVGKLVATDLKANTTTIASYGFLPLTYSGTTGWQYATWTN